MGLGLGRKDSKTFGTLTHPTLHSIYYTTCVNANEGDPGHPARIATPTLCCQTRRKLGW